MMYHVGQNCRKEEASNGIRSRFSKGVTILVWAATLSLLLIGCGGGGGGGGGTSAPPAPTYSITGKVTYNGAGVDGVTLNLVSAAAKPAKTVAGTVLASAVTANGGIYTFSNISNGTYAVSSADTIYGFDPKSVAVNGAAPAVSDIVAVPLPVFTVTGKIALTGGSGLTGVTVTLSGNGTGSQTTATNGVYTFTGLRSGSYTLTPSLAGYTFNPVTVTVNGAPITVPEIMAYPVFTITGKITLTGSPLAGITVTLYNTSAVPYTINGLFGANVTIGSIAATATSGSDGVYTINAVSSGSYTIIPSSPPAPAVQYVYKLVSLPTLNNSGVLTITDNSIVYLYNPEGIGNHITPDGPITNNTIIYNAQAPSIDLTSNAVSGIDFLASVPGGANNP